MARKKFVRHEIVRHMRLGKKRRKNKQKWKKAKGRHNKVREKRRGYPVKVQIGYKKSPLKMNEKMIISIKDLKNVAEDATCILSRRIGKKKRMEIAKKALEMKIKFANLKPEKILQENTK